MEHAPRRALDAVVSAEKRAAARGLDGVGAVLRVERCFPPEGDPLQARASLERWDERIPWELRFEAWARLADVTAAEADRARAQALADLFLDQLAPADREHARAHVPLFSRLRA